MGERDASFGVLEQFYKVFYNVRLLDRSFVIYQKEIIHY